MNKQYDKAKKMAKVGTYVNLKRISSLHKQDPIYGP